MEQPTIEEVRKIAESCGINFYETANGTRIAGGNKLVKLKRFYREVEKRVKEQLANEDSLEDEVEGYYDRWQAAIAEADEDFKDGTLSASQGLAVISEAFDDFRNSLADAVIARAEQRKAEPDDEEEDEEENTKVAADENPTVQWLHNTLRQLAREDKENLHEYLDGNPEAIYELIETVVTPNLSAKPE